MTSAASSPHRAASRVALDSPAWRRAVAQVRISRIRDDEVVSNLVDVSVDLIDYSNQWKQAETPDHDLRAETVRKAEAALLRAHKLALAKIAPEGTLGYRFERRLPLKVQSWLGRRRDQDPARTST